MSRLVSTINDTELLARRAYEDESGDNLKESLATKATNAQIDELNDTIEEISVQTDWEESDDTSLKFLKNKPVPISNSEIEGLFA